MSDTKNLKLQNMLIVKTYLQSAGQDHKTFYYDYKIYDVLNYLRNSILEVSFYIKIKSS